MHHREHSPACGRNQKDDKPQNTRNTRTLSQNRTVSICQGRCPATLRVPAMRWGALRQSSPWETRFPHEDCLGLAGQLGSVFGSAFSVFGAKEGCTMMRQSRSLAWAASGSSSKLACRDETEVDHAGRRSLTGTADPRLRETIQNRRQLS